MRFTLNGTEIELKQFLGTGSLNVLTSRGEVKAQSTDFLVTFGDGITCVLPQGTLVTLGLDLEAVARAIQADIDKDLELEVENQMRKDIAAAQAAILPSGTAVETNRLLAIRRKVADKLRGEGLIVPADEAEDFATSFDLADEGDLITEETLHFPSPFPVLPSTPSPAERRFNQAATETARKLDNPNSIEGF